MRKFLAAFPPAFRPAAADVNQPSAVKGPGRETLLARAPLFK
jgi:hypothetical protein